jgi:hypothetical protein
MRDKVCVCDREERERESVMEGGSVCVRLSFLGVTKVRVQFKLEVTNAKLVVVRETNKRRFAKQVYFKNTSLLSSLAYLI